MTTKPDRPATRTTVRARLFLVPVSRHRSALAALFAVSAVLAAPGGARGQSLRDAMTAAFSGNPGLDAERARQRADEESVRQEWAKALPQVSLDATRGKEKSRINGAASATKLHPESYSLTLSQPLFRGFQTLNGTRRAKSEVQAGEARLHEREQTVLLDTVTAYADVIRDRQILDLRRENVSFLQSELKATRARHRGGDLSKTDVAQARTRLFEGEADLAQAEADVQISEATFEAVVGLRAGALTQPPLPEGLIPPTLDTALAAAEAANPSIVGALHQQEAARRAKREAYGALLPTVSLDLSHGVENESSLSIDEEKESSIFVRMKMPLFQGGDSYSRIQESRARETGAAYEVTDTRRRTRAGVIDAWKQFHAAKSRILSAKRQVRAAREALRGVQIEVKVGERALFEVLDAQRELVNGEVALARAERDYVVSSYTLVAETGHLTAHDLRLPAAYPDRNDYVRRKNPRIRQVKHRTASRPRHRKSKRQPAHALPVRQDSWLQTVELPASAPPPDRDAGVRPVIRLRSSLPPN